MRAPLKEGISREGQRYVDQPDYIVVRPKPELSTQLAVAISKAFGKKPLAPIPILRGHNRIRLRWVRPDGTPK